MFNPNKTYKRELAVLMLFGLSALTIVGIAWPQTLAWEAAKFFTLPVFTCVGGAFGFDAYTKHKKG